jgi:uncharacterized protein (TIGR03435 family)
MTSPLPVILLIAAVGIPGASAQPAFEVASVKLTPPAAMGNTSISPPGALRFTATNVTLELLVELAFGIEDRQIQSAPGWMASEHYDVVAKPEGEKGLNYTELRPLLQQLLSQRFHLATHRETKSESGFSLELATGGPKLTPAKGRAGQNQIIRGGIQGRNVPLQWLASTLARPTGHPVVDNTGIIGTFDINLKYAPDTTEQTPDNSSLPSIFTALKEQLGLQLKSQKVPVEMLVIEHVEKVPTEN